MNLEFYLFRLWELVVDHAIPLVALLLLAILLPRLGRLTVKIIEGRLDEEEESTKSRLALLGALVYVIQIAAYFLIVLVALSNLGVPPLGAAVPATIVSAAVGFGAQSIIGDFLSGFFILSERQFGVGDYVSFDGTSTATEGTVVALTLRATKVRTPSGEVVMIPNGSAGVVTNYSQEWSRAVVNFDVPVRSGENLDDIHRTIEETAKQAIKDPSISEDVAGEVEILPATALTSPTAAGQPWRVNFRVLVVVNPARQWAVERGIRAALLSVFWDHFRTPFESPNEEFTREMGVASLSDAPTETIPVDPSAGEAAPSVEDTQDAAEAAARDEKADEDIAPAAKDDGPGRPSTTAASEADTDTDAETEVFEKPNSKRRDFWRTDAYDQRWKKVLSFGGRIRPSTTGLIVALFFTGGLALASSNPEDGNAGILSPAYWQQRSAAESSEVETTPEEPVETPATEPSYQPQPEPSVQPEPTAEQNPEGFSQNQEQLDTGASTEQSPAPNQAPQSVAPQDSQGTQSTQGTAESSPNDADATSGTDNFHVPEPTEEN
ncbi:mechanosensitive ion channel family protein [Corynebacterium sp. J010B-136]|uniref:mechanosensitive ion channel family protein n=1 Tax=Corynebacterium sp. J010B-136 TaxID=2099401 RepID=UPI000CFA671E|nr:mechanosensitive ion channel family protein [Corynebacterium sp. J010B-136]PQM75230.1 mechanosensitive ion channel protein MscS [Corynebacterium sp. J010B-136]